jgi:hypothetical protein
MVDLELVQICPVEWDLKRFRCYRYLEIQISPGLTRGMLEQQMMAMAKPIKNVSVTEYPGHWITWERKDRVMLYINLEHQCISVPNNLLFKFDREDIEHQASIAMRILKKFNQASFLRKRVDFQPSKIGYNTLERRQYHELIERGIRRRMAIYGFAPIANRRMSRKRVNERKDITALKRFSK